MGRAGGDVLRFKATTDGGDCSRQRSSAACYLSGTSDGKDRWLSEALGDLSCLQNHGWRTCLVLWKGWICLADHPRCPLRRSGGRRWASEALISSRGNLGLLFFTFYKFN